MVDWKKYNLETSMYDNGSVIIDNVKSGNPFYECLNDPYTAILKALIIQEGV